MSKFDEAQARIEQFDSRLNAPALRVKIWHWFTPIAQEEDGNRLVFSAHTVASRLGDHDIRKLLRQDPHAELALIADLQGHYYKSAIGLLAVGNTVEPVRLETFNTDGETGFLCHNMH